MGQKMYQYLSPSGRIFDRYSNPQVKLASLQISEKRMKKFHFNGVGVSTPGGPWTDE
jgi:hypothetical protein